MFLGIGPLYLFVIKFRLPRDMLRGSHRRMVFISAMLTNVAIAALVSGLGLWLGFAEMLMLQAPIVLLSSAAGVWLFYMQHQFEAAYWRRNSDWNFHEAAVERSEEHTSELQSLMRISYAVFCLKKKTTP